MPSMILYLIKCSISLSIVWLFYQLLLRRLTFYSMNRWYLLGYAALSFLLPLIHIALPAEKEMAGNLPLIRYIPVMPQPSAGGRAQETAYSGWDMLLVVLALGALVLLARLLIRYLSLRRMQKGAVLIGDAHLTIYHVNEPIIPFSFGRAIYLNSRLHSEKECEEIILHEYVHVRQRHTVDILVGEALCILTWFNPFSWLIRHSIRQNLEFIADRQVLDSGLDRKAYQYHLLKVVGESHYRLANNFNFSSLKKRIIMMNKSRSAKLHLVKFLFIVPLLGVLLVAFRDKVEIRLRGGRQEGVSTGDQNTAHLSGMPKDTTHPAKDTLSRVPVLLSSLGRDTISHPMYIIDEVESPGSDMPKVNPADILFVDVMKDERAVATFGAGARGGVVLIFTKAYGPHRKNEILLKNGKKVKLAVPDPPSPGSASPGGQSEKRDTLTHAQLMGPANITGFSFDGKKLDDSTYAAREVVINYSDTSSADYHPLGADKFLKKALIVLNGSPVEYDNLRLDPNSIESVSILKNKSATALYGPKAENGLVLIVTKKDLSVKGQSLTVETDKGEPLTLKADSIRWKNN